MKGTLYTEPVPAEDEQLLLEYEAAEMKPRDLGKELINASKSTHSGHVSCESLDLTIKHKSSLEDLKLELESTPQHVTMPSHFTTSERAADQYGSNSQASKIRLFRRSINDHFLRSQKHSRSLSGNTRYTDSHFENL